MKLNVLVLALATTAVGTLGANAQAVIEEHEGPPVVIEHHHPDASVTVVKPGVERKSTTVETNGSGDCTTRTVHKENPAGSKTVKKTNCD